MRLLPLCLVMLSSLVALAAQDTLVLSRRTGTLAVGPLPPPSDALAVSVLGTHQPIGHDGAVYLRSGECLIGVPSAIDNAQVTIRCDRWGTRSFPIAQVARLDLGPGAGDQASDFVGAVFINGDALPGAIAFLDERNVGLNTGKRVVTIPRERVSSVVLAGVSQSTEGWHVNLVTGDQLIGKIDGRAGAWSLTSAIGTLDFKHGWTVAWQVSDASRPFTDGAIEGWSPAIARDQLHDGRPLAVGGRTYGHGLAIRGDARLSRAIGGATQIVGEISVVEGTGTTVRILADDTEVASLQPGAAPVPFSAALGTAKKVTLEVSNPVGSPLVIVGWPTLVR